MNDSVTTKAYKLLKEGRVDVDDPTFAKLRASVITMKDGTANEHDVIVWRDGHWTCTCENFVYSKSENVNYWGDETRAKPECKHALSVKLSPDYKEWIRMIVVPTNKGFALLSNESIEEIHVKSLEEAFSVKKFLPKVKTFQLDRGKRRISFGDIFDN